jgi:hypothetical protein
LAGKTGKDCGQVLDSLNVVHTGTAELEYFHQSKFVTQRSGNLTFVDHNLYDQQEDPDFR